MRPTPNVRPIVWKVVCLLVNAAISAASAQTANPFPGRTAVVIAIPQSFPYNSAQAVIVRRVNAADHDLILVRAGQAQPGRLAAAIGTLQAVRARYGDTPNQDMLIRVPEGTSGGRISEAASWADLLAKSGRTHHEPVPGLEQAQYIRLYLPNHTGSGGGGL
jgi:hypothetical protein